MFITILHGDHEKTLFNSHCKVEALLSSIKQCCGCEPEEMIELADESGQLKNLLQYPQLYASELLKPRETYIPFSVKRPEGSSEPVFVALLKDEVIDSKLLGRAWREIPCSFLVWTLTSCPAISPCVCTVGKRENSQQEVLWSPVLWYNLAISRIPSFPMSLTIIIFNS
uniref:Uncharacterized protein CXorf65 homolog isoform X1 n=1 Tax=Phascolarctos cinereus TaxID=38626 RepID=A0A6P5J0T7_PHACI|nr:uncharacterized protein CXorf65 homolog isoform X1 [Phascolarctos cinereus]XP_020824470.1 uncharacterized protein CXorf65 homolog isoform X1 [Phascolarctos cinereus]